MGINKKERKLPNVSRSEQKSFQREISNQSFYTSTVWRSVSYVVRHRTPICEVSRVTGENLPAEVADHIIPIKQGGAMYDFRNIMSMSHAYHNIKSGKERHTPVLIDTIENENGELIPKDRRDIIKLLTR